jgi:hypothetical protein
VRFELDSIGNRVSGVGNWFVAKFIDFNRLEVYSSSLRQTFPVLVGAPLYPLAKSPYFSILPC